MCTFFFLSLEDFDVEEEDEEALIEQRRIQRQAIVQVCDISEILSTPSEIITLLVKTVFIYKEVMVTAIE